MASRLEELFTGTSPVAVAAAYLFGSHAENRAHRESDIDVGVVFPAGVNRDQRFERALRLSAWLQAELHTSRVDLVVLDDAPPGLAARVTTTGIRVLVANGEREHAFRRDAQLRAADVEPFLRRTRAIKRDALGR